MKPLDLEKELEGATPERLAKSLLASKKRQRVEVEGTQPRSSYPPTGNSKETPAKDD